MPPAPKLPPFPFGLQYWSPLAADIMAAGPLPSSGVWCPRFWFEQYEAANDDAWLDV
jgi:hypothetical protein